MAVVSRGQRVNPHRYMPRIIGTGHTAFILPCCSCGWTLPSLPRGDAKKAWREHQKAATA